MSEATEGRRDPIDPFSLRSQQALYNLLGAYALLKHNGQVAVKN